MKYFLFLVIVCCGGCVNNTNTASRQTVSEDSLTFIWTKKDSVAMRRYSLSHQYMVYHTTKPGESFSLLYDSVQHQWLFRDEYDSSTLFLEREEVFTVNGVNYNISKLILNKGATDGEMTYIVDKTAGLLAVKSNTWRYAMYRKTDDLRLSALILRIITDEEFYPNQKDTTGPKFATPRIDH
jgi:hypothetical protein